MEPVSRPDDESHTDSTWREIVQNYGERARLDPDDPRTGPAVEDPRPASYGVVEDPAGDVGTDPDEDDDIPEVDRFRPPEPPPVALPRTWQRRAAWGGVLVAPVLALLLALLRVQLPAALGWGLVAWFVGGFLYLVATMPRAPREPWDDGSRV